MRLRLTILLLIMAVCLVSCASPTQKLSLDDVHGKFNEEFVYFETLSEIFSSVPDFREYLRDELHLENIYLSSLGMAHDDKVFLGFISDDELERAKGACKNLSPSNIVYTTLNIYDKSAFNRMVEAIEFSFSLQDSEYPEASSCSIFYVPSEADREFIAENPYRFYCGTTIRLNTLDKDGWYIFINQ